LERWATFDCYGTLVDWNAGIAAELERVVGGDRAELLARYHRLEPQVQAGEPSLGYREVMVRVLEAIAQERGVTPAGADRDALGRSLPGWPVFPEVPPALAEMRRRGWRLAILSNSDRDLIEASIAAIGVPVDLAVVASEIRSYKPAHRHWETFFRRSGAGRARHVHVAQSHFHDIVPCAELGLHAIWINRLGEAGEPRPARELRDLSTLPETADELLAG
jgi:2-haloacid dehalogenase